MHERFALDFSDVFEEDDERLDAEGGEPRRLCFPSPCRERRAHRFRCVRGERGNLHAPAGSGGGFRRIPPDVRCGVFSFSCSPVSVRGGGTGGTYGGSGLPATTISTCSRSSVSRSSSAAATRSSAARRSVSTRVATL